MTDVVSAMDTEPNSPVSVLKPESDQSLGSPKSPPLDLIDTGKGLKVQTTTPHLVSLGSGRLSVAITLLTSKGGYVIFSLCLSFFSLCLSLSISRSSSLTHKPK
ncbi:pleckstrin homology-like domain family B member 1 [Cyprinus carpio]|uniref:Pleckstrin homology-like domain family B member 1 n=1 Tax=Cyprinus carpio TaxID=7962 RepID=A0A9Q9VSM0_CYPCA|nr:pleckstrin homology-like domain family B member 1 [Cyprinus carpio]